MQDLIKKMTELLKIKNIITLLATIVFVVMALTGAIETDSVMLIVTMVFTYFFNKDVQDKSK